MRPITALSRVVLLLSAQQPATRRQPPAPAAPKGTVQVRGQHAAGGRRHHRQGQERQPHHRPEGLRLHRARRRQAAKGRVLRVSKPRREAAAVPMHARRPETEPAGETRAPAPKSVTANQIAPRKPGDIKYKDRRLLVMFFDMTSMPISGPVPRPDRGREISQDPDDASPTWWPS